MSKSTTQALQKSSRMKASKVNNLSPMNSYMGKSAMQTGSAAGAYSSVCKTHHTNAGKGDDSAMSQDSSRLFEFSQRKIINHRVTDNSILTNPEKSF